MNQVVCCMCQTQLNGTWNITSSAKQNDQVGKQLGITDGYFVGFQPNWIQSYCLSCFNKQILSSPLVNNVVKGYQQKYDYQVMQAEELRKKLKQEQLKSMIQSSNYDSLKVIEETQRNQDFNTSLTQFQSFKVKEDEFIQLKSFLEDKNLDYHTQQNQLVDELIYVINSQYWKYQSKIITYATHVQDKLEIELKNMKLQEIKIQNESQDIYDNKTLTEVQNQLENAIKKKQNIKQQWKEFMQVHQDNKTLITNLKHKSVLSCIEDEIRYSELESQPYEQSNFLETFKKFYEIKKYQETLSDFIMQRLVKEQFDYMSEEKQLMVEIVKVINNLIDNYYQEVQQFSRKVSNNVRDELKQMNIRLEKFEEENESIFDVNTIKLIKSQLESAIIQKESQVEKWEQYKQKVYQQ